MIFILELITMKDLPELFTELGNMIKEKRVAIGLSQDELAWRCSLHLNAIWKIENAKSEIKLSTLISIFTELGISFTVLEDLVGKYSKSKKY